MRLWHKDLIPVLPNAMLVSQWRECIAIKRQWEKGTLKHRLVSYIMNHPIDTFHYYVYMVVEELNKRNIKFRINYYEELMEFNPYNQTILRVPCVYPEHNNRYLRQCYYNLQEKYDRGIITQEEWERIEDKFGDEI